MKNMNERHSLLATSTCSNILQYAISHANNSLRSAHWFWLKGKSSAIWDYIGSPTTHKTLSIKPEPSFKLSLTSFPHMQCRFMNFWTHISWDFQIFSVKASSIKQYSAVYEILDNNCNDWLSLKYILLLQYFPHVYTELIYICLNARASVSYFIECYF